MLDSLVLGEPVTLFDDQDDACKDDDGGNSIEDDGCDISSFGLVVIENGEVDGEDGQD